MARTGSRVAIVDTSVYVQLARHAFDMLREEEPFELLVWNASRSSVVR